MGDVKEEPPEPTRGREEGAEDATGPREGYDPAKKFQVQPGGIQWTKKPGEDGGGDE